MDIGTIAGLFGGIILIIIGQLLEHGNPLQLLQITAFIIVFGGTIGATLVSFPPKTFIYAVQKMITVFIRKDPDPNTIIESLISLSTKARKEGIVSLEQELVNLPEPFLKKALSMAVDGAEVKEIKNSMETEMHFMAEHEEYGPKVWEAAGGYAPTIGIIGAVIGLIQVMQNLTDIDEVGKGIAVAFVATIYGVASANMLFLPAASKLKVINQRMGTLREMMLEGVGLIVEGVNPMIIRDRLSAFLAGEDLPKKDEAK